MSSFCLIPLQSSPSWKPVTTIPRKHVRTTTSINCCANNNNNDFGAKSFFLNPSDERILKQAFKEPVAFMGGMFAGLLRLDLNEDPLKEWVTRTVEASGFTEEELDPQNTTTTEEPQQIDIE